MGFTQESVKKLMSLLDLQEDLDEKTYIELSNAAKYLYDKTCIIEPSVVPTRNVLPSARLCNRHKITALIKIFAELNYVVPQRVYDNDTGCIQHLYNILINSGSISEAGIKRRYYSERNADMLR
tara:strand:- start:2886 stop:3257 length:372 start_codon:yes stop_codon:yes gene_type:complete